MGEALITRRGGGGSAITKATDISDSIVWDGGSSYGYWEAVCVIDPNKTYLAHIGSKNNSDDSTGFVSLLISKGVVICEVGGARCEYGVDTENNWIFADGDDMDALYKFYVYLLE